MLQETVNRDLLEKRIAVRTSSSAFSLVLERLLTVWGFSLCRFDDQATLLLSEEGCAEPFSGQKVIWLSSSNNPEQGLLGLPVSVELLWQTLEQHFHCPPRMHMRKAVDLSARVLFRGEWHETHLSSLSDMGTRFSSDRELVKQEQVIIEITVCGERQQYHGQVIFSMAEGPSENPLFQSGVVFHKQGNALRDDLRFYLIRQFLGEVRDGMEPQDFQAGLEFLDLSSGVRRALLETD